MSTNIFSQKRLLLLFRQHFIHNAYWLLLSTVAYIGVVFIVLSIAQTGNNLQAHDLEIFQAFLIGFVSVFGILYVGHSFPALRTKESTISYLMLPASLLEKFVFEFIIRIGLVIVLLPFLFWCTFNLQGYLFTLFTSNPFESIGIHHTVILDVPEDYQTQLYVLIAGGVFFVLSLAFLGAATFTKQPLVKTLFTIAVIILFFVGYSYIVVVQLDVGHYNPPKEMLTLPLNEVSAFQAASTVLFVSAAIFFFVAFRKLKEREV